jgi:hypothetical protein
LNEVSEKLKCLQQGLSDYLKAEYGEKWRQHFAPKKKKEIWEALTQGGKVYPSLATFYSHVQHLGLEKVLNRYLDFEHFDKLKRILKLRDAKSSSIIGEITKVKRVADVLGKKIHRELRV